VEVAAGDRTAALVFRVMEPPSAEDLHLLEEFGTHQGVAIYLAVRRIGHHRPAGRRCAPDLCGGRRAG